MSRRLKAFAVGGGALVACAFGLACSSEGGSSDPGDGGPSIPDASTDGGDPDAMASDAGPRTITITTSAPGTSTAPRAKASATWSAWRDGEGAWQSLPPAAPGTYTFVNAASRWAIALACDDTANDASTMVVISRPQSTAALDVTLDTDCALAPARSHTITGTLSNVSVATSWLDFGYPLDTRGAVLPVSGTSGDYEIVNVVDGTWDLFFGVRDDSFGALTKMAIARGKTISADMTFDLDLGGVSGFTPGSQAIVVHGVDPSESFEPTIRYVTSGDRGIAVAPGSAPDSPPDIAFAYATVPAASQVAGDRYKIDIASTKSDDASRNLVASFHAAVAIDATLPPVLAVSSVALASSLPYVRLTTTAASRPNTASWDVLAEVAPTARSHRRWRASIDASLVADAAPIDTMPDLSTVPGFVTKWALPSGTEIKVTTTAHEAAIPLGDGTMERVASSKATFTP